MKLRTGVVRGALLFLAGIGLGGYLFADSQPRSFLALANCDTCYRPNDLAGLIASVGIQHASAALPRVVKETDRCLAIEHPFRRTKIHFVVFPKKDVRDIADLSVDDQPYLLDCLAVVRSLVVENGLRDYPSKRTVRVRRRSRICTFTWCRRKIKPQRARQKMR